MATSLRAQALTPHLVALAVVFCAVSLWQLGGLASEDVARHWSTPVRAVGTVGGVLFRPIARENVQTNRPLIAHIGATLGRWALGFAGASVLGLILGFLMGAFRPLFEGSYPAVSALRALPSAAIWPLCALVIGYNYRSQLVVISFGALWPVLLSTARAVQGVAPELRDVMRFMKLEWYRRAWLRFRSALPGVFTGLELAAGIAFLLTVSVEWFWPANGGLGWFLSYYAENREQDFVMGGVLVVGLVGFLVNGAVRTAREVIVWWEEPEVGWLSTLLRRLSRRRSQRVEVFSDARISRASHADYVTESITNDFGPNWSVEILEAVQPPYVFPRYLDELAVDATSCRQRDIRILLPGPPLAVGLFARSWMVQERLAPETWRRVLNTADTIGRIVRECETEEIGSVELDRAIQDRQDLASIFEKEGVVRLVVRTRLLTLGGRPCVLIQENFPTW